MQASVGDFRSEIESLLGHAGLVPTFGHKVDRDAGILAGRSSRRNDWIVK
jgi:hypothetical protein